jgi:hypothetical protein
MKKVRFLDLTNTGVTDEGLAHLHGMTDLRRLFLTGTQVSDAGVSALQRTLPKVDITR